MTPALSILLVVLGQAHPAQSPAKAKPKLAVFDVQALSGVTADLAQSVSGVLVVEVRKRASDYSVIGADEIRSLLNAERMRQQMGCCKRLASRRLAGRWGPRRSSTVSSPSWGRSMS